MFTIEVDRNIVNKDSNGPRLEPCGIPGVIRYSQDLKIF